MISNKNSEIGNLCYTIVKPQQSASITDEFLDSIITFNQNYKSLLQQQKIIKVVVLMDIDIASSLKLYSKVFDDLFGSYFVDSNFLRVFVPHKPADGFKINLEIVSFDVEANDAEFTYYSDKYNKNAKYLLIETADYKEIYGTFACDAKDSNVSDQSNICFEMMRRSLKSNEFDLRDIYRQWMYLGHITETVKINNRKFENYHLYNTAWALAYSKINWINGYPSATAIGTNINASVIEFSACKSNSDIKIIPLHNPKQIDAHSYSNKYIPVNSKVNSPKFERGKVVISGNILNIFVSGTAAIIGEDSVNEDIYSQTKTTLDNIANLVTHENLLNHGIVTNKAISGYSFARVYIKKSEDYHACKEICDSFFGNTPISYVIADICRKELLVEIEATISRKII